MPLPTLSPKLDSGLLEAVRNLVRLKDQLDAARHDSVTAALRPSVLTDPQGQVLSAFRFAQHVVPFLSTRSKEERLARYPTDLTLAEPWRGRDLHPSPKDDPTDLLTSDARAMPGDRHRAEYFLIGPLGLAIPHEGKNRVAFFRANAISAIPCALTVLEYPSPDRLALYLIDTLSGCAKRVVCVLDGSQMQEVLAPGITLPLLHAYGVGDVQPWPASLPRLDMWTIPADPRPTPSTCLRTVDLKEVARQNERMDALARRVPVSVSELDLTPRLRPLLAVVAVPTVATLAGSMLLPSALQVPIGSAVTGFVAGAGVAMFLKLWTAPRAWRRRGGPL